MDQSFAMYAKSSPLYAYALTLQLLFISFKQTIAFFEQKYKSEYFILYVKTMVVTGMYSCLALVRMPVPLTSDCFTNTLCNYPYMNSDYYWVQCGSSNNLSIPANLTSTAQLQQCYLGASHAECIGTSVRTLAIRCLC